MWTATMLCGRTVLLPLVAETPRLADAMTDYRERAREFQERELGSCKDGCAACLRIENALTALLKKVAREAHIHRSSGGKVLYMTEAFYKQDREEAIRAGAEAMRQKANARGHGGRPRYHANIPPESTDAIVAQVEEQR